MNDVIVRSNLPEFSATLKRIGYDFERRTVRIAVNRMARIFRDAAKAKAPELRRPVRGRIRGALRASIRSARSKYQRAGAYRAFVGVRAGKKARGLDAFYWKFLEGGWMPRGPGRKLKGGDRYRALQRARARRGGARTYRYPFLEPAFIEQRNRAIDEFYLVVAKAVKRYEVMGR